MSNQSNNKLFSEFPPVSTQTWEEKIKADLKGADYDKKLIWKTIEGFNVRPYYRSEDLSGLKNLLQTLPGNLPFVRGNKKDNNWLIRQDVFVENEIQANTKALEAIKRGAESIAFIIPENSTTDLSSLLTDFPYDKVELNFAKSRNTKKLLQEFIDYCIENKIDTKKIKGSFDFDPLGYTTLTGQCYDAEICSGMNISKALFAKAKEILPNMHFVSINGKYFNNAGASIMQEMAFTLSIAVNYLDFAQEQGIDVQDLSPHLRFNLGVGSNYFMEIAKLRAIRYLWAKIIQSFLPENPDKAKIFIHSETSLWNKTLYDPYVNMLRTTTEAMSAVLGSTDSLRVLPFNAIYENNDEFGERIARNQQIILKEESYFNKVADPAAGSYYVENLTNSLIEQAWKLFLEIDEQGGYLEALKKGIIQEKIAKTT
ncbi:MAG: methylmalonyl-CoA mutase subunit beta, partial [Bacteroidales bacterium]|nr:methylmalonyl-CoA mutase subunit beta [Bacteroidales bacterium]